MAIAFDNATASSGSSLSYTCGAGATILVGIVCQSATAATDQTCTYNGVSMTLSQVVSVNASDSVGIFYLFNPPTGSALTLAAGGTNPTSLGCISLTGTSKVSVGASGARADTGTVTSSTLTLTTTKDNSFIVFAGTEGFNGFRTLTATTGTRRCFVAGNGDPTSALMGATQTTTTAGNYDTTLAAGGSNGRFGHVALEIVPPATTIATKKTLLGVGK